MDENNGIKLCYANDIGETHPHTNEPQTPETYPQLKKFVNTKADQVFYSQKSCDKWFDRDNCTFLPSGFDPELFAGNDEERPIDLGFVGRGADTNRKDFLKYMKKTFKNFIHKEEIYFHAMAKFYEQCKIVPNLSTSNEINMRIFEATAAGALLITKDMPHIGELFEVGKEIVTYKDFEDLKKKIKYYLKNDSERERIAAAGKRKAFREHKYSDRADIIIKTCLGGQEKE